MLAYSQMLHVACCIAEMNAGQGQQEIHVHMIPKEE